MNRWSTHLLISILYLWQNPYDSSFCTYNSKCLKSTVHSTTATSYRKHPGAWSINKWTRLQSLWSCPFVRKTTWCFCSYFKYSPSKLTRKASGILHTGQKTWNTVVSSCLKRPREDCSFYQKQDPIHRDESPISLTKYHKTIMLYSQK